MSPPIVRQAQPLPLSLNRPKPLSVESHQGFDPCERPRTSRTRNTLWPGLAALAMKLGGGADAGGELAGTRAGDVDKVGVRGQSVERGQELRRIGNQLVIEIFLQL
jgi:hypothetical protein